MLVMFAQNHDHRYGHVANLEPDKFLRQSPRLCSACSGMANGLHYNVLCARAVSSKLVQSVHHHLFYLHRQGLVILAREIGTRQFSPGRGDGLLRRLELGYCRVTHQLASPVILVLRRQIIIEHRTRIGDADGAFRVWSKERWKCPAKCPC